MKFFSRKIVIQTKENTELVNITDAIKKLVKESGVKYGCLNLFTTHTTTALTINESEPGLEKDIVNFVKSLVPEGSPYFHHHYYAADGRMAVNAWAHIRASLLGANIVVPIEDGKAVLGRRQSIYYVELDGPQRRNLFVQIQGE